VEEGSGVPSRAGARGIAGCTKCDKHHNALISRAFLTIEKAKHPDIVRMPHRSRPEPGLGKVHAVTILLQTIAIICIRVRNKVSSPGTEKEGP
jgi:hypothetical protein